MLAPFRATFRGMVVNLQSVDFSQQGIAKRAFELVDTAGRWFLCWAHGKNASQRALENFAEIVFYFGTGRPSAGTSPGAVYAFQDAVFVKIQQHSSPWIKREQVEILQRQGD